MSDEPLPDPYLMDIPLASLAPGTIIGGFLSYNGTTWTSSRQLPIPVEILDDNDTPDIPTTISYGNLYKKPLDNALYWATLGGGEIALATVGPHTVTFADSTFRIYNSTTTTKQLAYDLSAISPSTLVTTYIPNYNSVLPAYYFNNLMIGNTTYTVSGDQNTIIGRSAGSTITSGTSNTLLGYNAQTGSATAINRTVLGTNAVGTSDNSLSLSSATTDFYFPALTTAHTGYLLYYDNVTKKITQDVVYITDINNTLSTQTLIPLGAYDIGGSLTPYSTGYFTTLDTTNISIDGLTTNQLIVSNGQSAVTSLGYSTTATASFIVQRDASVNILTNNIICNITSTTSTGGTNVLTAASSKTQILTGPTFEIYTLPDATTLNLGHSFEFINNSGGIITINNASSSLITTVESGARLIITCTSISTTNGSFTYSYLLPSNSVYSTSGLSITGTLAASSTSTLRDILPFASASYALGSNAAKWSNIYTNVIQIATGASSGYILISDASGNASWSNMTSVGVTTVTGTADQVLVNATSGTPTSGAITLTLPQSIATTSTLTFNGIRAADGTVTIPSFAFTNSTNSGMYLSGTNQLSIAGNGQEAIRIDSSRNVTILADLTVNGTTTTVNSTVVNIADNIIILDYGNTGDTLDSGFATNYSTTSYGAIYRAAGGEWYVKNGIVTVPGSNIVGGTLANLNVAKLASTAFQLSTGAGLNYILSSDVSGNASWVNLPGVTTLTGTANQVLVNATSGTPTSGAITLTLPQDIATTSLPTFGGATLNLSSTNTFNCVMTSGTTLVPFIISGTHVGAAGEISLTSMTATIAPAGIQTTVIGYKITPMIAPTASTMTNTYGLSVVPTFRPFTSTTVTTIAGIYVKPSLDRANNSSITTNSYGVYVDTIATTGGGTSSFATVYGGYFNVPTAGTANVALYSDNFRTSQITIGAASSSILLYIAANITNTNSIRLFNTITNTAGGTSIAVDLSGTFTTAVSASNAANIWSAPTFKKTGIGSYTNTYGIYSQCVGTAGATNSYAGYFVNPTFGVTRTALYATNLSIGYAGVSPPTNGAIFSGVVGIGINNPVTALDMVGSFRLTINTTNAHITALNSGTLLAPIIISGTHVGAAGETSITSITATIAPTTAQTAVNCYKISSSIAPTASTMAAAYGMTIVPTFNPFTSTTVNTLAGILVQPILNKGRNSATVTNTSGILVETIATSGAGTTVFPIVYGVYVKVPTAGSSRNIALYSDNLAVGYTGTNPPTNGAIISGSVGIGNSSPSYPLDVTGTMRSTGFILNSSPVNGYILQSDATGIASWVNPTSLSVTTLTGTADQILVNGTSATPTSGAITLTLPQSINTTSSPSFAGLTLSSTLTMGVNPTLGHGGGSPVRNRIFVGPTSPGGWYTTFCLDSGSELIQVSDLGYFQPSTTNTCSIGGFSNMWLSTHSYAYFSYVATSTLANGYSLAYTSEIYTNTFDGTTKLNLYGLTNAGELGGGVYLGGYYGIRFTTVNTTKMSILQSGNVGINTLTPAAKLEVAGNIILSGVSESNNLILVSSSVASATASILLYGEIFYNYCTFNSGATNSSATGLYCALNTYVNTGASVTDATTFVALAPTNSGTYTTAGSVVNAYSGKFLAPTIGTNNIALWSNNMVVGISYLNITPPANGVIIEGYVGIGKSSPSVPLDVVGSVQLSGTETITNSYAGRYDTLYMRNSSNSALAYSILSVQNDTGAGSFVIFQNSTTRLDDGGPNVTRLRTDAGTLYIGGNGGLKLGCLLDANAYNVVNVGGLGIGTASPANALDVVGGGTSTATIRLANGTSSGYGFIQFGQSATGTDNIHIGTEGDGKVSFWNGTFGAGTRTMTINAGGNVSIGNTNNTYKLDVTGDIMMNTGGVGGSGTIYGYDAYHYISLRSGGNNLMKFYEYGNFEWWNGGTSGSKKLILDDSGQLYPAITNTYNLGTSSYTWANTYTNNLYVTSKLNTSGALWNASLDLYNYYNITTITFDSGNITTNITIRRIGSVATVNIAATSAGTITPATSLDSSAAIPADYRPARGVLTFHLFVLKTTGVYQCVVTILSTGIINISSTGTSWSGLSGAATSGFDVDATLSYNVD
jgi:hypothetical protein